MRINALDNGAPNRVQSRKMAGLTERPVLPLAHAGIITCRTCGLVGGREMFQSKVAAKGRVGTKAAGVPASTCWPCRAAYQRAKNRARPLDTLSNRSLTKMGLKQPDRVLRQAGLLALSPEQEAIAAAKDARAAWREWIERRAPDAWVARYYEASGKPWRNPRVSTAESWRMRYRLDETYRCAELLRMRVKKKMRRDAVSEAIRNAALGKAKAATLLQRLGYGREQLKAHIERQFKGRMSWAAFSQGKIHIDHIRPLSAFDLSDEQQFRDAFSLHNMQPMWARDNLAKGARVEHLI